MTGFVEGTDRWMGALVALELKGVVLLALVALAVLTLRRGPAAGRHWVWLLGVMGLLALPFVQAAAPRWSAQLPALPAWAEASPGFEAATSASSADGAASRPAPAPETPASAEAIEAAARVSPGDAGREIASPSSAVPGARIDAPRVVAVPASLPFGAVLLSVWAFGALSLLAGVALSLIATWRLEARTASFPPGKVRTLAEGLAAHLGIRRPVRLLRGEADAMPVSWGWRRPVVLLPAGAEGWSRSRLAAVLLHELAHVRRADCLSQVVAEVTVALHWLNPLAWLAAARLRAEREYACDDLVLRAGARASDYADELLALARSLRADRATPRAAVAMARPSSLAGRLRAVLDATRRRELGRIRAAGAGVLAVFLVTALGALTPAPPATVASVAPKPELGAQAAADIESARSTEAHSVSRVGSASTASPVSVVGGATLAEGSTFQAGSCGTERGGWESASNQSNNDRRTLRWSKPGCDVEVRVDGDVEFTSDFRDVARLDRDALMRIEEREGRTRRMLEITADANGRPSYEYRVDREERAFDGTARAWYEGMLLQVFRRAGFMAHERVQALLREGGVPAVLRELDELDSDYVFSTYTEELLKQARDLSDAQALEVVERARDRVDSDYYLASILKAFAVEHLSSNAMLDAYLGAAERIESDFYKSEVLKVALDRGGLSPDQVGATVTAASSMESDYYLAEVLKAVADEYALAPEIRERYLDAVTSIESDYYRAEVLGALLARNDLSSAELAVVLRAAGDMGSDAYIDAVLAGVASKTLDSDELMGSYIDVSGTIESDHYRAQALGRLVDRGDLPDAQVAALIRAAAGMDSDFYKAQVLTEVVRRYHPEGATREVLADAVRSIDSSYYRGQVAELMIRE